MKRKADGFVKKISRIIGVLEILAGAVLVIYVAAWLAGLVRWSADIVFAAMGAGGLFLAADGVSRVKRRKSLLWTKQKWLNACVQGIFIVAVSLMIFAQAMIISSCGEKTSECGDFVVIFGAKIYGNTPSAMLAKRIASAAEILLENPDAIAIACGGYSDGTQFSEAQVIRDQLAFWGIDESRVILEDASADSRESVRNACGIIESLGGGTVTVVSSDYHLYRCMRLFRSFGCETNGRGASLHPAWRPVAHFREMLSLIRDYFYDIFVRGG